MVSLQWNASILRCSVRRIRGRRPDNAASPFDFKPFAVCPPSLCRESGRALTVTFEALTNVGLTNLIMCCLLACDVITESGSPPTTGLSCLSQPPTGDQRSVATAAAKEQLHSLRSIVANSFSQPSPLLRMPR